MFEFDVYKDIAQRTGGDIYVGVVGPVRTGKSTFISRFMENLVIPNINGNQKSVATAELPQPASGKTIMTTEPKFIPGEAVEVNFDGAFAKVKLIDCVGYMVDGALGHEEEGEPRLVKTPWYDEPIPFDKASAIGTHKVIEEHSTVGIVVTTDGSFTDIPYENYLTAEERVVNELKSLGKPFIVVYNTVSPDSRASRERRKAMEEKYGVTVVCENVATMDKNRFEDIIKSLLMEFKLCSFDIEIPAWMQTLSPSNRLIGALLDNIRQNLDQITSMKSFSVIENCFLDSAEFEPPKEIEMNMAEGYAKLCLTAKSGVFYKVLSEECGECVADELELIQYVKSLSSAKKNYEKLKTALENAEESGYGVVAPQFEEAELSEPEVVKRTGGYSVRMKAKAKSLHIIRADVETDVNPVYGSKKQCDDFVEYFKNADEENCWETGVFGRPLKGIIGDEISQSSYAMSENVKFKLRKTINKAMNEKKSNLFCILI